MSYCPNCGEKAGKSDKYCTKCGKAIEQKSDKQNIANKSDRDVSKKSLNKISSKKLLLILLSVVALVCFVSCILFLTKYFLDKNKSSDKTASETDSSSQTQSQTQLSKDLKDKLDILKGIEQKYLPEAETKAQEWSASAKVCRYYVAIYDLDKATIVPNISYVFCSKNLKTEVFQWSKNTLGDVKSDVKENKLKYENYIPDFPPPLSAYTAMVLGINEYEKNKPKGRTTSFSVSINEDRKRWFFSYTYYPENEKRSKTDHCYVYFNEKLQCEFE